MGGPMGMQQQVRARAYACVCVPDCLA
eukprot:COSAG03_NODE_33743_length_131_cov_2717.187500_1_plen_26_part_10